LKLPSSRGGAGISANSGVIDAKAEETVYTMAVWLIAQGILVEVKDFLVAVETSRGNSCRGKSDAISPEEILYHELLQSGCLDGTTSIPAICYRFGLDRIRMEKIILWGRHTNRLEVVRRGNIDA